MAANKLRLKRREAGRARCFVWHTGAEVRHDATTTTTTTTRLLLLLGSRVLLHAYDYTSTTTRVHNSTTPLLHYYTTTLPHHCYIHEYSCTLRGTARRDGGERGVPPPRRRGARHLLG